MSKIIQKKIKVLSNIHLTGSYYRLAFNLPQVTRVAQPGQFLMLHINQGYRPFLRRPFSIHRVSPQIEILYEVVGKGTQLLSQKKPGQYLGVLGPLGNGFNYQLPITNYAASSSTLSLGGGQLPILIGGGIGIAPLLFLAEELITVHCQPLIVLIGAKTRKEILCQKEFANLGASVKISTDDGSAGFKGKVTELLKITLSKTCQRQSTTIYACGPKSMLKEIAIISKQYNIPAQISLDEYMACGLGVCLGCMIETKEGYQRVCKEGPVFDSTIIMQQKRSRS